jgi:transposase
MSAKKLSKKLKMINSKTLLVTVDIGKYRNTGYARTVSGCELSCFEFTNTGLGFRDFWTRITNFRDRHDLETLVVGFESTGHYGQPLQHFLAQRGVHLVQVNPMHTKRLKELDGNSPNKTDQKDPRVIADIILLGRSLTVIIPRGAAAELRGLVSARNRVLVDLGRKYNQLEGIVFCLFPEFFKIMKGFHSKSSWYLLAKYPLPEDLVRLGVGRLSTILRRVSKGRLGSQRAQLLYEAAQVSGGIKEDQNSHLLELGILLSELQRFRSHLDLIEDRMEDYLAKIPYSNILMNIRGLGIITVATLISEVGDFRQYHTVSEVIKLAGLDLYEISSGEQVGKRRISKRGRYLLRKILFYAAINTVRKGGILHEKYQSYLGRGYTKVQALTAISRKLLAIIYALARDNRPYQPHYESIDKNQLPEAA